MFFKLLHQTFRAAGQLLDVIDQANLVPMAFALFVFWKVGESAVANDEGRRRAGLFLGLVSFVGFVIRRWFTLGPGSGSDVASTAVRALVCAGFCTAMAWMLLAIGAFLCRQTFAAASDILHRR